jgi:hypothetical protein
MKGTVKKLTKNSVKDCKKKLIKSKKSAQSVRTQQSDIFWASEKSDIMRKLLHSKTYFT